MTACFCGSDQDYANCCQPFHQGQPAPSAEALMRSRYSAFVTANADYLQRSWHPSTRPDELQLNDNPEWLKLEILSTGQQSDSTATVHFRAFCKDASGKLAMLDEMSRFCLVDGYWLYLDGDSNYQLLS